MKQIFKPLFVSAFVAILLTGCDKKEVLPFYKNGNAPVLSSSTATVAAAPADSSKEVITFSWSDPGYANDSSTNNYLVEIDSSGRNFSKAVRRSIKGAHSTSFTAKQLNDILIGYGFSSGTAYSIDVRVISSYANNNEQYISNTLKLQLTPYKIPPKIPVPAELIIVGDASVGGWDNPAQPAAQEIAQKFALLDETTYGGIFYLNGGAQYLLLPKTGDWGHKFGGASKTGGDLLVDGDVPGSNTPAPDADGWYKIIVDFQTGKYTVTPAAAAFTGNLFVTGDATASNWTNKPPNTQKFTPINSSVFDLTLPLNGNKSYIFLSEFDNWDKKFAIPVKNDPASVNGGVFQEGGNDILAPATDGTYNIQVNFLTMKFTVTQ